MSIQSSNETPVEYLDVNRELATYFAKEPCCSRIRKIIASLMLWIFLWISALFLVPWTTVLQFDWVGVFYAKKY